MKLDRSSTVKPALRKVGSLAGGAKVRIAVFLAAGVGLAVVASRVEGHLPQLILMMLAECFGVCAAQLIRNTPGPGARESVEPKPMPVLYAGSLQQHFGMDDFEIVRSGLDHSTFRPVTPRSESSRRVVDRWL